MFGLFRHNVAAPYPVPECRIFFNPSTGYYGYSYRFEGREPHYTLDTCLTLKGALQSADNRDELQYLANHHALHSSYGWPRSWQDDAAGEACLDGLRDSRRERAGDYRREAGVWPGSTPKPVRIRTPNPGPRPREVPRSAANIQMGLF